ncbi:helix-turn-helix domain-containing protein [Aliiroseovarius sp. S1339]|nr:helix-turn-helix domain-containing protein [Aliiroseovarius sp. S1339]MCK8462252.1 helix-turn-helix domain-containing protein [Aliiroseovarius sp. S1339]
MNLAVAGKPSTLRSFELFVSAGFCDFELSSVTRTLTLANELCGTARFTWRIVSDTPGLTKSRSDMIVRSELAVPDHLLSDVMIVVGGTNTARSDEWLKRARAMQRKARPVALLSDAATAYIKATHAPAGKVTTHWRDVEMLSEEGYHPNLTHCFSENSDGIVTAAGAGATAELILGLIAPMLDGPQVAELGNRLLIHTIRKSDAEQPKNLADNAALFDGQVTQAIRIMESTLADPIPISELVRDLRLSTRQLERNFREVFDDTPARFYKRLRTRRAKDLVEETLMPLTEISVATGFGSLATMANAVKEEFGQTPSKLRARRRVKILKH